MNTSPQHQIQPVFKALLTVIIVTLVILCILLVQQYRQIQRLNYISQRHSLFSSLHGAHSLTPADASSTQAWMTFDYIDRLFALPPQYLQNSLAITDSRYPRLTIATYAQSIHASQNDILLKTQEAIRTFSTSTVGTSTSASAN